MSIHSSMPVSYTHLDVYKRQVLDGLLSELRGEGAIDIEKKRIVPGKVRYVPGTFCGTARGFGFVTPEDGTDDIFIPAEGVGKALHGDQVLCQVLQLSLIHI